MDYSDHRPADHPWSALHRIADAVGYPLDPSRDEPSIDAVEAADTVALMRLWVATTDAQGRRRILSLARQEASKCGHSEPE